MKSELLVDPKAWRLLASFLAKPNQPLMLVGAEGMGKRYLARYLAAKLLGLGSADRLESFAFFTEVVKEAKKQEISIDQVRGIISSMKLKTTGRSNIRRVVAIIDAHKLSEEAQNALLKILEEPNDDTAFILTV